MADDRDSIDLDEIEERFKLQAESDGYQDGLQQGRKAGQEEGYAKGYDEGSKFGSEIGLYRGLAMVWLQLLHLNLEGSSKSSKLVSRITETLDLINDFPKTNHVSCEQKLSDIRLKFKQLASLLGATNLCDIK